MGLSLSLGPKAETPWRPKLPDTFTEIEPVGRLPDLGNPTAEPASTPVNQGPAKARKEGHER